MDQWLSDKITMEDQSWSPSFALQSSINWARALDFEISHEHGTIANDQLTSCNRWFSGRVSQRQGTVVEAAIFAPLFHSLTFAVSLKSHSVRDVDGPWLLPPAIITWYYSIYHAFRSILAACDGREPKQHAKVAKAFSDTGLRSQFPHPLNVVATHEGGESYSPCLPSYQSATSYNLSKRFLETRDVAQGMILQYIGGTAKYYVDEVKDRLRIQNHISNFQTAEAQRIRDLKLPHEYNFLHCAFRYRGKANYRDGLFLTYGQSHSWLGPENFAVLGRISQFLFICALSYIGLRVGQTLVNTFLSDLRSNFRGRDLLTGEETFWMTL